MNTVNELSDRFFIFRNATIMKLTNLIQIAIRALQRNKLRALLTMLGIIIGVAAVIAMVAIGQGSKQSIQ